MQRIGGYCEAIADFRKIYSSTNSPDNISSAKIVNKPSSEKLQNSDDDLAPEYQFDCRKAKTNRFTDRQNQDRLKVVVLDQDVAQVFTTPESFNKALRALIEAMP
jgi:hypothetical protein